MKRKPRLQLVAVKLTAQQISMLDAEVARQAQDALEVRATRSSVLRRALVELVGRRRAS